MTDALVEPHLLREGTEWQGHPEPTKCRPPADSLCAHGRRPGPSTSEKHHAQNGTPAVSLHGPLHRSPLLTEVLEMMHT